MWPRAGYGGRAVRAEPPCLECLVCKSSIQFANRAVFLVHFLDSLGFWMLYPPLAPSSALRPMAYGGNLSSAAWLSNLNRFSIVHAETLPISFSLRVRGLWVEPLYPERRPFATYQSPRIRITNLTVVPRSPIVLVPSKHPHNDDEKQEGEHRASAKSRRLQATYTNVRRCYFYHVSREDHPADSPVV
jgi:hypothetical protein